MIVALLLAACTDRSGPTEVSDRGPPVDTGSVPPPEPCLRAPCASDVATASWSGDLAHARVGQAVAARDELVLVGAPFATPDLGIPYATLLTLELVPLRHWHGKLPNDLVGASVAISDAPAGERLLAVGQVFGSDFSGAMLLREDEPSGPVHRAEHLQVRFDRGQAGGAAAAFAKVGADEAEWFVVGASGAVGVAPHPGEVVAVPANAEGVFDVTTAPLRITGEAGIGWHFSTWDPDGDGQVDLVTAGEANGVYFFEGPWLGHRTAADRTGAWDEPAGPTTNPGTAIADVGDVTGDGRSDLAFSSGLWGEDPLRTGRVYLVPGGLDLRFGSVEDLPIQVHGEVEGDGMGFALAGGDLSGDGAADLVVGASGVFPGDVPGSVLVFTGPVADGVWHAADAASAVHGEYPYDNFGRAMAVTDADGDAAADLVVGAQGWPAGGEYGKVYVLTGAALFASP